MAGLKSLYANVLVVLSVFLLPLLSAAQEKKITGKITDDKGIAVPYANILIGNRGMVSADDGSFIFPYSEHNQPDSLCFSVIGFQPKKIAFSSLLADPHVILLPKSYELTEIPVSARAAEIIVKKAIDKIPENYPQKPYFTELFFRQFHRENGKAARLIEAALKVYDPGYINPQSLILKEQFEITELRRSKVFEKNGFNHDDHLVDLFKQNIVHYPRETILNASAIEFFHFEKDSIQLCDTATTILFYYQNPSDPKIRWGKLIISQTDHAILSVAENTSKNDNFSPRLKAANNSEWHFFEGETNISYKKVGSRYYLDSISFFYRHNIVSKIFGTTDYTVDEYFNFWSGMPDTISAPPSNPGKNFQNTSNLYARRYTYNPGFWKEYGLATGHPADPSITGDFEKHSTLEEQFLKSETP